MQPGPKANPVEPAPRSPAHRGEHELPPLGLDPDGKPENSGALSPALGPREFGSTTGGMSGLLRSNRTVR